MVHTKILHHREEELHGRITDTMNASVSALESLEENYNTLRAVIRNCPITSALLVEDYFRVLNHAQEGHINVEAPQYEKMLQYRKLLNRKR